jgi:arylsulfatase A
VIEHSNKLALREGRWKFIAPAGGDAVSKFTAIQTANLPAPQLYDLANDPGETKNLATAEPARADAMAARLAALKASPRSRP